MGAKVDENELAFDDVERDSGPRLVDEPYEELLHCRWNLSLHLKEIEI